MLLFSSLVAFLFSWTPWRLGLHHSDCYDGDHEDHDDLDGHGEYDDHDEYDDCDGYDD